MQSSLLARLRPLALAVVAGSVLALLASGLAGVTGAAAAPVGLSGISCTPSAITTYTNMPAPLVCTAQVNGNSGPNVLAVAAQFSGTPNVTVTSIINANGDPFLCVPIGNAGACQFIATTHDTFTVSWIVQYTAPGQYTYVEVGSNGTFVVVRFDIVTQSSFPNGTTTGNFTGGAVCYNHGTGASCPAGNP